MNALISALIFQKLNKTPVRNYASKTTQALSNKSNRKNESYLSKKKSPCEKEKHFTSSSNISFNISPVYNFTEEAEKLKLPKISVNPNSSHQTVGKSQQTTPLKSIGLDSSISNEYSNRKEEFMTHLETRNDSSQNDQENKSVLLSPKDITTLYKMKKRLDIHSEARIIDNSISDSPFTSPQNDESFVNYISPNTLKRKPNTSEMNEERFSLDSLENFHVQILDTSKSRNDSGLYPIKEKASTSYENTQYYRSGTEYEISKQITIIPEKTSPFLQIEKIHSSEEVRPESFKIQKSKLTCASRKSPSPQQQKTPLATWSIEGGIYKTSTSMKRTKELLPLVQKGQNVKRITNTEKNTLALTDPFILAATAEDPFLNFNVEEDWIHQQEFLFKKWFNMLLTQHTQEEIAAPLTRNDAKERNCYKLNSFKKSALNLFNSFEIQSVLMTVYDAIEERNLRFRQNVNIHFDFPLQKKITKLLTSYNPLWLRIALKTIYGDKIKIKSNAESTEQFFEEKFFKDKSLLWKYKSTGNPNYVMELNKSIMKKYLSIVYFLDKAKMYGLIPQSHCLFQKDTIKESNEMLIEFSKYAITGTIGDITKYLKSLGYVVEYRQGYIEEFSYRIKNLSYDLRDGVRLTKIMELMLFRNDITQNLRVPAIDRRQKNNNVGLVFNALSQAGYQVQHNIEPCDIVDGNREKTLSLLWQIIYVFKSPLIIKAAANIQKWWRSLSVCVERRILQRRKLLETASTKIQRWYRRQIYAEKLLFIAFYFPQYLEAPNEEIQRLYKTCKQQKRIMRTKNAGLKLQKECKLELLSMANKLREAAATVIQYSFKKYSVRNKLLKIKQCIWHMERYISSQQILRSTILIQEWYRSKSIMRKERNEFLELKSAVCIIQERYRGKLKMRKAIAKYTEMRSSIIQIQKWLRSVLKMRSLRNHFLNLKKSVVIIEQRYIALKKMRQVKNEYHLLKYSTSIIQRQLQHTLQMKRQHNISFLHYVSWKLMLNELIQREIHNYIEQVVINIQRRFRANKLMRFERNSYQKLKESTIHIQTVFRRFLLTKGIRGNYINLKNATLIIQQKYRAHKLMCRLKNDYQTLRKAAIYVQVRFRAAKEMMKQRQEFLKKKQSCIVIQRCFRMFSLKKKEKSEGLHREVKKLYNMIKVCREQYLKLTNFILNQFSAYKPTQEQTELITTETTPIIKFKNTQNHLYSTFLLYVQKPLALYINMTPIWEYLNSWHHHALLIIQQSFLGNDRDVAKDNAAVKIQNYYRSYLLMKKERQQYIKLKNNIIIIQRRYRAYKQMCSNRTHYQTLQKCVINIQKKFRSKKLMENQRKLYLQQRRSCICIQKFYRCYLLTIEERAEYLVLKRTVTFIQQQYRAKRSMKIIRENYLRLRQMTLYIQRTFRANRTIKLNRLPFLEQRNAAINIQKYFRGYQQMKKDRKYFLSLTSVVVWIQRHVREWLMKKKYTRILISEAIDDIRLKKEWDGAATRIQVNVRKILLLNPYNFILGFHKIILYSNLQYSIV